jgi:glycosyltransferase involved in cell wall biosynthesis
VSGDGDRLSGRSIVCIGTADWTSSLWTNQQHLMSRLARDNRVVFTESQGLRRPTLAGRDVRRVARRIATGLRPPRLLDGVWVVSPLVLPAHGSPHVRRLNVAILKALVRRAMRRGGLERPILWAYNPHAHALAGSLGESLLVYHCVDDIAAQEGIDSASFEAAEAALASRADLVFVSAPPLVEHARRRGARKVVLLPNVADVDHFRGAGELDDPPELAPVPHPRLVFAGALAAKKLDLDLLLELARRRPDWSLVMVGPQGEGDPRGDLAGLEAASNIHLVGAKPFRELPAWLGAGDVGLIPYAANPYTAAVFPMKVYEYLAAGLPVVSTPLPSLRGVDGIEFAATPAEFEQAVDSALRDESPDRRAERVALAEAHSWERRVEEIGRLVQDAESAGADRVPH